MAEVAAVCLHLYGSNDTDEDGMPYESAWLIFGVPVIPDGGRAWLLDDDDVFGIAGSEIDLAGGFAG